MQQQHERKKAAVEAAPFECAARACLTIRMLRCIALTNTRYHRTILGAMSEQTPTDPDPGSRQAPISSTDEKEQRGADERHECDHHKDRRVRNVVDKVPGQQRKEQAAQASGDSGEPGRAADSVLGEEVGHGSKHIGGEEIIGHDRDADGQESPGGIGEIRDGQAGKAERGARVHGDAANRVGVEAALLEPPSSPASGNATGISEQERNPAEKSDLR